MTIAATLPPQSDAHPPELPALQFVSNVIEIRPDKKYLLVFEGDNVSHDELQAVFQRLYAAGFIGCLGIAIKSGTQLTVIEAPQAKGQEEVSA